MPYGLGICSEGILMKKLTPIMFAVALAMGIGSAYAGPGKDYLDRGIPPGDYHV